MALIKCKECGNEITAQAEACAKCGAENWKRQLSASQVVLGLLVGVGVIAYLANSSTGGSSSGNGGGSRTVNEQASRPAFETTSEEITTAYEQNAVAADNRFKNKRFYITGDIANINTDIAGHATIVLAVGGQSMFHQPEADLKDSDKPRAAQLTKGERVRMVCTGAGEIARTPILRECTLS